MLGTLDGEGEPEDADPVNRQSAKVQCVVARAAPTDLTAFALSDGDVGTVTSFIGFRLPENAAKTSEESQIYWEASPVEHVSSDDPPFLLVHGDRDDVVPYRQSEVMREALIKTGVEVELLRIPGGSHGPTFGDVEDAPDYLGAMVDWFNHHLISVPGQ